MADSISGRTCACTAGDIVDVGLELWMTRFASFVETRGVGVKVVLDGREFEHNYVAGLLQFTYRQLSCLSNIRTVPYPVGGPHVKARDADTRPSHACQRCRNCITNSCERAILRM